METPTLSLVMPCYKYAHFLPEAIESVARQSVLPFEVIVVNDGSPDNTLEVAREMRNKYPQLHIVIVDKENGGLSSARNAGIEIASGKYIMSFDADDILRPDAIKEHLALAEDNAIVTCGLMAFGDESYTARPETATLDILLQRNCIYSNSMFPRALWEKVGGFDEDMKKGLEDWECWIRMAKAGAKFKTSDHIALLWRRHGNAMSTSLANPNWAWNMKYFKSKHPDFKS
jgi:glycosyltransferase involved in cell wall biosynthesis